MPGAADDGHTDPDQSDREGSAQGALTVSAGLLPGVLDTGAASLATFTAGIYAARTLEPELLGVYALYFFAAFFAGSVTHQLVLLPSRIIAVGHPRARRVRILPVSLLFGFASGAVGASLTLLAGTPLLGQISMDSMVPIALTAAGVAVLSPLQDHVRTTLHLSGRSWSAALVSAVQLITLVMVLLVLDATGVGPTWIALGALASANLVSLFFGLGIAFLRARPGDSIPMTWRSLVGQGRFLMVAELASGGAEFAGLALVGSVISAQALGFLEATRVVAQPIYVLSNGIGQVVGARLMEAGKNRAMASARRWILRSATAVFVAGIAYLGIAGFAYEANPMLALIPTAYEVPGLVSARIASFMVAAVALLPLQILYGASRSRAVLQVRLLGGAASLLAVGITLVMATSFEAGNQGAFAIPVALAVAGATRGTLGWLKSRQQLDL